MSSFTEAKINGRTIYEIERELYISGQNSDVLGQVIDIAIDIDAHNDQLEIELNSAQDYSNDDVMYECEDLVKRINVMILDAEERDQPTPIENFVDSLKEIRTWVRHIEDMA